jgi:pimeloyl-ACP methyl ester carboxylesterase
MLHFKTFLAPSPNQDWVTFVHGAGGSSSIWYKQIKAFAEHFNVLLIDLRGHGQSQKGDNKVYTFKEISSDVIEVLDHLKLQRSHFVGISLGTIIIREISEAYPERVKNLVLGGAILNFNLQGKILMRLGDWFKTLLPYMLLYKLFAFVILPRKNHHEARSLFVNEAKKLAQKEFVRWYKLTASVNRVLKIHRDRPVNAPTLYIMGSEDYMFLEPIRDVIKSQKKAILEIVDNCGHVVNVEQPQVFNKIVLNYLLGSKG